MCGPSQIACLMGVKVSKPLTALHGRPFFFTSSWRLRAVISTANAGEISVNIIIEGRGRNFTISCNVRVRVSLRNIAAAFANNEAKLDYVGGKSDKSTRRYLNGGMWDMTDLRDVQ